MMEELMLVNPEDAKPKRHRRKAKAMQIIFPKPVRRIRANPDYPEIKAKGKALIDSSQESTLQVRLMPPLQPSKAVGFP
jgi:hypothetical protein